MELAICKWLGPFKILVDGSGAGRITRKREVYFMLYELILSFVPCQKQGILTEQLRFAHWIYSLAPKLEVPALQRNCVCSANLPGKQVRNWRWETCSSRGSKYATANSYRARLELYALNAGTVGITAGCQAWCFSLFPICLFWWLLWW